MKARTYLLPIALAMASIGTVLLLSALQIVVQQNKVELAASIVAALVKEAKQKDAITQAELDFVSMFFV